MSATDRDWTAEGVLGTLSQFPGDVVGIVGFTALAWLVLEYGASFGVPSPLRALVAVPLLFFLPGYVLLTVLYPGTSPGGESGSAGASGDESGSTVPWRRLHGDGLVWSDRAALSFGTSLVLVPLFGLLFPAARLMGYYPFVVIEIVAIAVAGGAIVGAARRLHRPPTDRYQVNVGEWAAEQVGAVLDGDGRLDVGLNVALVVLAVGAAATLGYGLVAPQSAEAHSSFYLLGEEADGRPVASGFPAVLESGESQTLVVGVENDEGERTTYEVVGELQRVQAAGANPSLAIEERERVDGFQVTLDEDETWRGEREITPVMTGQDLRLVYYLYRGEAPAVASDETAYRTVFIWVDGVDPAAAGNATATATPTTTG